VRSGRCSSFRSRRRACGALQSGRPPRCGPTLVLGTGFQLASFSIEPATEETIDRLRRIADHAARANLAKLCDVLAMSFLIGSALVYVLLSNPAFVIVDFFLQQGLTGHVIQFVAASWIAWVVLRAADFARAAEPDTLGGGAERVRG
jgi:hypothetical protein